MNEPVYCPTCKQFTTNYYQDFFCGYCQSHGNISELNFSITLADAQWVAAAYDQYTLNHVNEEVKRGKTIELGDLTHFNTIEELMADLNDEEEIVKPVSEKMKDKEKSRPNTLL